MLLLISIYLLLVFVLPLALSLAVSMRSLPQGGTCPHCRAESLPLLSRGLQKLSALLHRTYQRRWCLECGWEGIVRIQPESTIARRTPVGIAALARQVRATARTLDVRRLEIDGQKWRVLLQFWVEPNRCFGRLVFMAPSGRLWTDAMHPFTGRSADEILGQVLSLPEGSLATRLREVASD